MAEGKITIRLADLEPMRLFVWELRQLVKDMERDSCPHATRLHHAIDRLEAGAKRLKDHDVQP
jgi:hypothetical protein